mmetsp:Transcript_437/g.1056  ORF Transcript_437/g.1056 Transcript_437/m.1056 type:complete len:478 (+) Transcript_437:137-1570(+)
MKSHQLPVVVLLVVILYFTVFYIGVLTMQEQSDSRPSILYMLSSLAVSGGNISILQEAIEMRRKGMRVSLAVSKEKVPEDYISLIMALSSAVTAQGVRDMVIIYDGNCCWPEPPAPKLVEIARNFDIVVATHHITVMALEDIVKRHGHVMPAYYVQDYEPWFICSPFSCPFRNKLTPRNRNRLENKPLVAMKVQFKYARSTYSAVKGKVFLFAKTNWIKGKVESIHPGTQVHLVTPSIDHTVYYTESEYLAAKEKVALSLQSVPTSRARTEPVAGVGRVKVIAMLRPRTPRRNTMTSLDTLLKLAYEHPRVVQVSFFGVDKSELTLWLSYLVQKYGNASHRSAENVEVLGLIKQRHTLAKLYRSSDLFVDMSWWQAFGRTAVEAMASGCVPIMPGEGASSDVCGGGRVCRYHDGRDAAGYYDEIVTLVYNHTERLRMMTAGIERAHEFSIQRAASSVEQVLTLGVAAYRKQTLSTMV